MYTYEKVKNSSCFIGLLLSYVCFSQKIRQSPEFVVVVIVVVFVVVVIINNFITLPTHNAIVFVVLYVSSS